MPGTYFSCSVSRWVTHDLYLEWFKFFIANIPPTRPVLLIEDGHASHISIEVIELAQSNDIHLLCLPSHTTHLLQPLDVGVFKSLKSHYKQCQKYMATNPGRIITTDAIASILSKAWSLSFTPVNIMAGFKKSGAFPLNPGEVTDRHLAPSKGVYEKESSPHLPAVSISTSSPASSASSPLPSRSSLSFTSDQHQLYQTWYTEGFDLPDPDYHAWLAIYHPETQSSSAAESLVTHVFGGVDSSSDALSEVLSLPEPTARTRKKRRPGLNSKAITLTDDEILSAIRTKEANKIQREAEKEKRKIKRELKKEERKKENTERKKKRQERTQAKRKGLKSANRSLSTSTPDLTSIFSDKCVLCDSDSDAECPVCGLTFLEDDSGKPWVCCDGCQSWFDFKYTALANPEPVPRKFFCHSYM